MKTIEKLTQGSVIRVAGVSGKVTIETLAAYCADGHTTIKECEARDVKFGRKTQYAWTMQAASIITADYPGKFEALAAEQSEIAAAPIVETGDLLQIDNEWYSARVLGNYPNPVKLTSVPGWDPSAKGSFMAAVSAKGF